MTFLPELNNKPQTEVREQLLFADSQQPPSNSIQTLCSPANWPAFQSSLASWVINKWFTLEHLFTCRCKWTHMYWEKYWNVHVCSSIINQWVSWSTSVVISSTLFLMRFPVLIHRCVYFVHLLSLYVCTVHLLCLTQAGTVAIGRPSCAPDIMSFVHIYCHRPSSLFYPIDTFRVQSTCVWPGGCSVIWVGSIG